MKLDTSKIEKWRLASKTKAIKIKHLRSLLVDDSVTSKFLLDTIEGREPLYKGKNIVICIGEAGDAWQQTPNKLLKKYDLVDIDDDGWFLFNPKPNNEVNCIEITQELADSFLDPSIHSNRQSDGNYYILGQYGEEYPDGLRQSCKVGDFICQDINDKTDQWIVARKIFFNTYTFKD